MPAARQAEILHAVTRERLSLRAAERTFGVARQTIAAWIKKKPRPCPRCHPPLPMRCNRCEARAKFRLRQKP